MNTKLLKQKILDLAIRGKLVPQDPNDEPASVLLEKIKKEKQELIKQGKIKKDKNESTIFVGDDKLHYEKFADGTIKNIEEEIPFEIPETWCWCRLKNVSTYGYAKHIKSKDIKDSDWVLDLEDIESESGKLLQKSTNLIKQTTSDKYIFKAGQILYSKLRPYLNKVVIADDNGLCTTEIMPLTFIESVYNKYAMLFLMSNYFVKYAISCSYGCKMPRLGTQDGKNALMPLPSLAEQERIVAKIEELFTQVDKIEEEKQSLLKLIDKTKEKVLDLAMKGKLVEQDPNDEPASALLEKIYEEKKKLAKEGKIKLSKDELLPPKISDDNDYYQDLPNNWKLTLLKTICEISTGNSINAHIKSEKYTKNTKGLPYIGTKDISYSNRIDYNNGIIIPLNEINNFRVAKSGSTLLCIEGGSCGRKFGLTNQDVCYGNKLCAFKSKIFDKFLYYYIQSSQFLNIFKSKLTGIIGGVNIYKIKEIYIPVPPLNEQKRIVVKIENIFTKLEEIKDSL